MINLTLDILFKKQGKDLETEIIQAVTDARKIIFGYFSGGKVIGRDQIVSTSKRIPRTVQLAYCKYYDERNIYNIACDWEEFVSICLDINRSGITNSKEKFAKIIPDFKAVEGELVGTFLTEVKRGLNLMLMSLWSKGVILLPANVKLPTTTLGNRGKLVVISQSFDTEVLRFFQKIRDLGLDESKYLSNSVRKNIKNYGWRLILTTDWHKVEDVSVADAVLFLKAMSDHKTKKQNFISFVVPIREMLSMLVDEFGSRTKFSMDDFLQVRKKVFGPLSTRQNYSPKKLDSGPWMSDIAGFDLEPVSKVWARTQVQYINRKKKRGMKSYESIAKSLTLLNQYLFYILPRSNCTELPLTPKDFTRKYLDGDDTTPLLIDHLSDGRSIDTTYGHFMHIDLYFNYLESLSSIEQSADGFKNPILRNIDFPRLKRSSGTNKSIVSHLYFSPMLNYFFAVEQFVWHIIDTIITNDVDDETRSHFINEIEKIPRPFDSCIDTEVFGFTPFVYHQGKVIPIKTIPKMLIPLKNRKIKNQGSIKLPNIIYLYQTLVAFETGIRNIHIRWLDSETYDQHINRDAPLPPVCELLVNTDKVKKEPWTAFVSKRVIILLDKLKFLNSQFDEAWVGNRYWYDGHVGSDFGEISPLFCQGGPSRQHGQPSIDTTCATKFKHILFGFQNFANDNLLFDHFLEYVTYTELRTGDDKLNRVWNSDITSHGARATVVSRYATLLPLHVIGKHITGQESEAVVAYYVVLDKEYMKYIGKNQSLALLDSHPLLDTSSGSISINAESIHSKLRQAIDQGLSNTFSDFGATSFDRERNDGVIESGISIAKENGSDQIAHNSTHMCPYNNNCPKDVIVEIGSRQCGQCWASIKTIDHLPRISAHIRALHAQIEEKEATIKQMIANGVGEKVLESHDSERIKLASEESAWIATYAILENFRKNSAMRDSYLVTRPEIVEKHLTLIVTDRSPLTNILNRIQDAKNYPEYMTPQLKSGVTKLRNQILRKSGNIEQLINQPDGFELIDEFRGIIRGISDATDTTIEELSHVMISSLPDGNKNLLEAI